MKDLAFKTVSPEALILAVQNESERQIAKFGIQDRTPFEWLTYITEEAGEIADAIKRHKYHNGDPLEVVKEAIQAATLCLKVAEMYLNVEESADIK